MSTVESYTLLANALATLVWPLLAILIVLILARPIRNKIISGDIELKFWGYEIRAINSRSEQIGKQLLDIQSKIAELEKRAPMVADSANAKGPTKAVLPENLSILGQRVLWVDDKPEANSVVIDQLKQLGFEIDLARTTEEGLRLVNESKLPYNLILSDIGRTEDRGYDRKAGTKLLSELRASGANAPVIFFTTARTANMAFVRDAVTKDGNAFATGSTTELTLLILKALANKTESQAQPDGATD
jgi:CheY-like chemotaxis protein